ncbi:MAG: hypothetical protein RR614_08670, partial [Eubacterium sp.]
RLNNNATTEAVKEINVKEANGAQSYKAPEKKDVRIEKKEINLLYIISNNGDNLRQWLSDAGSADDAGNGIKVEVSGNTTLTGETFRANNPTADNPTIYKFYKNNSNIESNLIITLNVSAVNILTFNTASDPSAFLKKNGKYTDVVVTGMADENGTIQFGYTDKTTRVGTTTQWNNIKKALNDYMQAGNGFYIGHDSIWTIGERPYNYSDNSANTRQIMNDIF